MKDCIFPGSNFHGPISKKKIYKAFGPFTRCKPNADQEEWPCTKKWMCCFFFKMLKRVVLKNKNKNSSVTTLSSSLIFSYLHHFPKNISLKTNYNSICVSWALAFFLPEHFFCLSHCKTHWIMSVDNVGFKICLLGTSNVMVTLTYFPWCKPKWSRDEFKSQSHIS